MPVYPLLRAGLVAAVAALAIGVVAAQLRIPYALQIIVAALGALTALIHAILQRRTANDVEHQPLLLAKQPAPDSSVDLERYRKATPHSSRRTKRNQHVS